MWWSALIPVMHWMAIQVSDFHAPASFPHMMNLMSELFKMREMKENYDMMYQANRLLAWITSLTPPFELVEPLMMQLINILQETTVGVQVATLTSVLAHEDQRAPSA